MIVDAINSMGTYISNSNSASFSGTDLGIQDFFELMAAQLENQSMYDTVDNTEFIAQMAQFSALTQIAELNSTIQSNTAISMIGKLVSVSTYDSTGAESVLSGVVQQVSYKDGTPYLMVNDGFYRLTDILDVGSSESQASQESDTGSSDTMI